MDPDHDEELAHEELAIYFVMALVGVPLVIGAVLAGGVLDVGLSIGLASVVLAVVGLQARARWAVVRAVRSRLPRAYVRTDDRQPR